MVVFVAAHHNPQSEAHRSGLVDVPDVQNSRHNPYPGQGTDDGHWCVNCWLREGRETSGIKRPDGSYVCRACNHVMLPVPVAQISRFIDIFNPKRPLDVAGAHSPSSAPGAEDPCGHGTQRDAAAGFCITPSETAAGILLEELGDIEELAREQDEGENGWNAQRRNEIARKMQRIAGGSLNRYSYDEIAGAVIRAERGELRG